MTDECVLTKSALSEGPQGPERVVRQGRIHSSVVDMTIEHMGLTGFDTKSDTVRSSQRGAVLCNPWRNEILANTISRMKAAVASAFRMPAFSLVTA